MVAISVTLPCYNCADTLSAALNSLLTQTFDDFEIVAVDDGSADATAAVLRRYAARDERVRPIFQEHQGVVSAANAALRAAEGRYLARMDADDAALPERLAVQAALLDGRPELGLVGCRVRFGGCRKSCAGYAHYVDWTNTLLDHEAISLYRFVEFPVPNPSIMFRREVLEEHGFYRDGPFPEDYDLLLRWLEGGVRMAKADAELLVWNDPPNRLSRTDERYGVDAFYAVKSAYLARWLAVRNPFHPEVYVIGAGRVSRQRLRLLQEHGVHVAAYIDVDPNKIGQVIEGVPVLPRESLPPAGEAFALSYVGSRGAREDIGAFLESVGYRIGRDWLPVA